MSLDSGGLASAWIDEAGVFALTTASKLPQAKKYQRWVFSELAEQMTDMLPSSALFVHFSLSDPVSVLKCSISSAGTDSAATCEFHTSSCCLNLQVNAALSAGQPSDLTRVITQRQRAAFCASLSVLEPVLVQHATSQLLHSIAKHHSDKSQPILSHSGDFHSLACQTDRQPCQQSTTCLNLVPRSLNSHIV